MRGPLLFIAVLYGVAALCWLLHFVLPAKGLVAGTNRFLGTSLGMFATGLLFLLVYGAIRPGTSSNQNAANIRALQGQVGLLQEWVGLLTARVDSLTGVRK